MKLPWIFWLQTILNQLQLWSEIIKREPDQIGANYKEHILKGRFDTDVVVHHSEERNRKVNQESKQAWEIDFKPQFDKNEKLNQS